VALGSGVGDTVGEGLGVALDVDVGDGEGNMSGITSPDTLAL
jgi:hypothetical protein